MSRPPTHTGASPLEDADLVRALRAGDDAVFAALVDAWSGWMLRVARAHVPSDAAAEDAVQETWLAVVNGLDRFRGDSTMRTWVQRILVNQAKRRGISERRTVPFASLAVEDAGPTVDPSRFRGPDDPYPGHWWELPQSWPEHVVLDHEVHHVVLVALEDLPPRQRAVVALRDLEDRSASEVCALLDISPGNQRVLLHRGRAAVRACLERYFGDRSPVAVGR